MEYSPKKMNQVLQSNQFNLKKKFGQNFIVDEHVIDNIIAYAEIDKNTLVIEIGPGAGSLTYKLAMYAKQVVAFEIDYTLQPILERNLKDSDNVEILYEDFLQADVAEIVKKYDYQKLYVVANLPYYITTPILLKMIEDHLDVDKIVVMVQKEVGNRFKAIPGTRDYGSLSVYLQYYYDIRKMMDVSRHVFLPEPNVDSIVVSFTKKERLPLKDESTFFKLVRASFTQKRKTLRNNLKEYNLDTIASILAHYNLDLSVRAEQMSVEIFVEIANHL